MCPLLKIIFPLTSSVSGLVLILLHLEIKHSRAMLIIENQHSINRYYVQDVGNHICFSNKCVKSPHSLEQGLDAQNGHYTFSIPYVMQ